MPLYEYECLDCGAHLEIVVRGGQEPERCGQHCQPEPGCQWYGKGRLRRLISAPALAGNSQHAGKRDVASDERIAKAGLSKYVNEGNGVFRKTAGKGPDRIRR